MRMLLNGNKVSLEIIDVNDGLNYNRFFDLKTEAYELQLSITEFKKLIEDDYNKVRDEIKKDDEYYKDTSDFTNTNYCSLSKLLEHQTDFEEIVKTYLDKTLFVKIFNKSAATKYVINSTEKISVDRSNIVITGKVFQKSKSL